MDIRFTRKNIYSALILSPNKINYINRSIRNTLKLRAWKLKNNHKTEIDFETPYISNLLTEIMKVYSAESYIHS